MTKLQIAILSYRSAPFGGGQGVYVHDISKALSMMGHKVDVISGPPYPNLSDQVSLVKLPGLNLFQTFSFKDRLKIFWMKENKSLSDIYEFISVLLGGFPEMRTFGYRAKEYLRKKKQYDIVIDNQSVSYSMVDIQKEFPFIEIIHHPITKDFKHEIEGNKKILYRLSRHRWYSFLKMQKKVAPKINTIVTPSHNSLQDISKDFNCDPANIFVIQNGLDIDIFKPNSDITRNPLRLITTASADVPLKGLDYSLRSLAELKNYFNGIHLIVIGKSKEDGHTSRLIKELNIERDVKFKTGLTKEGIAEEYAKSSISLVSSLYEGFGYPVIEAMSCGVPLIAANTSSIPELVGEFATLIPSQNVQAQVKAIKNVIENYDDYKNIAEKGRVHIIEQFNWLKITEEYENIILKTIKSFKNADI